MKAFEEKHGVKKLPGFMDPALAALHKKQVRDAIDGFSDHWKRSCGMGAAELQASEPQLPSFLPIGGDKPDGRKGPRSAESNAKRSAGLKAAWARRKQREAIA